MYQAQSKEYHFWGAKELKIKRGKSKSSKKISAVKKTTRKETKEIPRTYTVKKYSCQTGSEVLSTGWWKNPAWRQRH